MSLDADLLVDRRRLKRHLTVWRLLAIAALTVLLAALLAEGTGLTARDHLARLTIEGVITADDRLDRALQEIAEDESVKALILRIDSPGGTVAGGETLYRGLRRVAEAKPVVAVMGGLATSAGYLAAIAGERIFARDSSITGSIGVILQSADFSGLLDKLGIAAEVVKTGPYKDVPSPVRSLEPDDRAVLEAVLRDMYDMFVDLVAERRALPRERVVELADGRIYTGRQALNAGLVDAIGGEREAVAWLSERHGLPGDLPVEEVRYREDERAWLDLLLSAMGKTLFPERLRLDGLVSIWHPTR